MGRVKSVSIKGLGDTLLSKHKNRFTEDFQTNKNLLKDLQPIKYKRTRNVLAGYITSQVKLMKKRGL